MTGSGNSRSVTVNGDDDKVVVVAKSKQLLSTYKKSGLQQHYFPSS